MKRIAQYTLSLLLIAACGEGGGGQSLVSGEPGGASGSPSDPEVLEPSINTPPGPILTEDFPPDSEPTDPCQNADAGCGQLPTADAGPACGDGIVDATEACDDANGAPGDGCSGACQVEPNFTCPDPGAACVSSIRCGDAIRVGAELCDDGNTVSGDGCNATCDEVEGVFACPPNGGPCATNVVCGDGRVTGDEVCDDGNAVDNDGCSASCLSVTAGFSCSRPGQLCVQPVVCGDGRVSQGEQCDEGNSADGAGCTAGCFREADYACDVPGQPCVSLVVCGDGILLGAEECDDGNLTAGDGCSATCVQEAGWTCPVVDSTCEAAACGDGVIAGDEECEDGDLVPATGDGCDASCQRETGFECVEGATSPPSICHATVCNDGAPEGDEACDDGNAVVGDGCNPFCQVEPTCTELGCQSACGDGIRLPDDDEECDDGNTLAGDGCSDTCQLEDGFACTVVQGTLPDVLELPVTFRDFIASATSRHPDFETRSGQGTPGLVQSTLDGDKKPVYTGICPTGAANNGPGGTPCPFGAQTSTQANFDQWYRDVPSVNKTFVTTLTMGKITSDVYQFPATLGAPLFPLDGRGWVLEGSETALMSSGATAAPHNFGFTSEIRHWFEFKGGERLTFSGDDDVWVFINGKLALDLGGLHPRREQTIVLEAASGEARCTITTNGVDTPTPTACAVPTRVLGLVVGSVYEVSLFHAERHTGASNFDLTLGGFVSKKDACVSVCGDGIRTPDERCDDGVNDNSYGSCTPVTCERGPHCGDNLTQTEAGEECDNGINRTAYGESGCARGCKLPSRCGDGQVDGADDETCDDGVNDNRYGSCTNTCQLGPRCGDGIKQDSDEECDDGLNDGSYGTCAPGCLLGPRCGDGQTQALQSEQCDDGQNTGAYGQCRSTCQLGPRCGDAVLQSVQGEQCDDGVNDGGYGECQSGCQRGPRCGDGVVQSAQGEQCDDSANDGGYGECAAGCRLGARCGDGVVQASAGETCDDGNRVSGDGCSSACRGESGTIH